MNVEASRVGRPLSRLRYALSNTMATRLLWKTESNSMNYGLKDRKHSLFLSFINFMIHDYRGRPSVHKEFRSLS